MKLCESNNSRWITKFYNPQFHYNLYFYFSQIYQSVYVNLPNDLWHWFAKSPMRLVLTIDNVAILREGWNLLLRKLEAKVLIILNTIVLYRWVVTSHKNKETYKLASLAMTSP